MLVLSRRIKESINIGSNVVIRVLKIRTPDGRVIEKTGGFHVVLGIEAPKSLLVLRSELEPNPPASDETFATPEKDYVP